MPRSDVSSTKAAMIPTTMSTRPRLPRGLRAVRRGRSSGARMSAEPTRRRRRPATPRAHRPEIRGLSVGGWSGVVAAVGAGRTRGHDQAPAAGMGGRAPHSRREWLALAHLAGEGVVVGVGARLAGAVDEPAQRGAGGRSLVEAPRVCRGRVVADGLADALALPFAVERAEPLGHLLKVAVALVERAGHALAHRLDERLPQLVGQRGARARDHAVDARGA